MAKPFLLTRIVAKNVDARRYFATYEGCFIARLLVRFAFALGRLG